MMYDPLWNDGQLKLEAFMRRDDARDFVQRVSDAVETHVFDGGLTVRVWNGATVRDYTEYYGDMRSAWERAADDIHPVDDDPTEQGAY